MTGTDVTPEPCCDDLAGLSTLTRRGVLKAVGAASAAFAAGTTLQMGSAEAATGGTLVVVTLRGGADGLTMLPPIGDPDYARLRPGIAVPASRAIHLTPTFGLHPRLSPLKKHWDEGRLAFVQGVGGPTPTRSHFDAVLAMEQASFGAGVRTGWLDRLLGVLGASTLYGGVTMGSATPHAMAGPRPTLTISAVSAMTMDVWDTDEPKYLQALKAMHRFAGPLSTGGQTSLAALTGFKAAAAKAPKPANGAAYPAGELGGELRDIARLIRGGLPIRVAHVEVGGYDVHSALGTAGGVDGGTMHTLLGQLGQALDAFMTDLGALRARVTVITASEFGRRVTQNGSYGVDHGRANAMMVLGAGVNGGRVHGTWPTLAADRLDRGDLAVTTDYRHVLAEVLSDRMGVSASGLSTVFPGFSPSPLGVTRST